MEELIVSVKLYIEDAEGIKRKEAILVRITLTPSPQRGLDI